jgi:hypothetical protein
MEDFSAELASILGTDTGSEPVTGGEAYLQRIKRTESYRNAHLLMLSGDDPALVGEAVQISRRTGYHPELILGDMDKYREELEIIDTADAMYGAPALSKWINDDPLNLGLAKGEVDNLAGIERFLQSQFGLGLQQGVETGKLIGTSALSAPVQSIQLDLTDTVSDLATASAMWAQIAAREGVNPLEAGLLDIPQGASAWREISDELGLDVRTPRGQAIYNALLYPEQRQSIIEEVTQQLASTEGVVDQLGLAMEQFRRNMLETQGRTPNFTDIDDIASFADWLAYSTGQAVPLLAAGIAASLTGGTAGTLAFGYTMGVGDVNAELLEQGINDPAMAFLAAVPYAALERIGAPPQVAAALRGVAPEVLQGAFKRWAVRKGVQVSKAAFGEFVNEAGQAVIADYAVDFAGGEDVTLDSEQFLSWFNEGMAGAAGGAAISVFTPAPPAGDAPPTPEASEPRPVPPAPPRPSPEQAVRYQNAGTTAETLGRLDALAQASNTRTVAPERFEGLIAGITNGETAVYVPAEDLREYAQSAGINITDLGVDRGELSVAASTGNLVAVPIERYLTRVTGTDAAPWFAENAVLDPLREMSLAEQRRDGERILAEAREEVAKIQGQLDQLAEGEGRIYETVRSQLVEAGRTLDVASSEATFFTAFFRSMASRYGGDAYSLFERFAVRVQSGQGVMREGADGATLMQDGDVRAPEFRAWFGDSKVVDENGEPLVVYHGTPGDFSRANARFRTDAVGSGAGDYSGRGYYFTPDPLEAQEYGPNVVPTYLSLQNPYVHYLRDYNWRAPEDWSENLKSQGYDGVIVRVRDVDDVTGEVADDWIKEIVAFSPTQIKSVNNRGTFDPDDPRILYQFAGPQSQTADIHALARAKDMIEAGADVEQVRRETGWFRGADGKWRYEISDKDASIDDAVRQEILPPSDKGAEALSEWWSDYENLFAEDGIPLGDILEHDRLYAAYPDLRLIPIKLDNGLTAWGQVDGYGAEMTLNPARIKSEGGDLLSTILHEVQHLIQRREGFARGGSQKMSGHVRDALRKLVTLKEGEVSRFERDYQDLFRQANEARRMVGYASMYQDFNRLIDYSRMDRPSGVFRHIRNATSWFYTPIIQENKDLRLRANELNRALYTLPRRGARRNQFLRQFSFDLAQLLRDAVPPDRWALMQNDPRKTTSMIKAFEREASKASARLKPHYDLTKDARLAKSQFEANQYRSPFEIYQLLAGEIEARNTQNRAQMTDEERRNTPPEATMDRRAGGARRQVFTNDVIVVMQSGEIETPFIANMEEAAPAARTLYQDDSTKGPRGNVQFPAAGLERGTTVINLFEGRDLSTLIHESGHYFYEVFSALASEADAPQQMKDDLAKLQAWMGVEPGATPSTEAHETMARGMERYVMEGKAPSAELASVFGRFRAWLTQIYRTVRGLNVQLDDEVRGVFDRMLATDEEIQQVQSDMAMSPLFADAPAGMSEPAWGTYQRIAQEREETARTALLTRKLEEIRKRREAWWKDERAAQVQAAMDRLGADRVYRAIEMLANGRWLGEEGEGAEIPDVRIDRAALVDMFGEDVLKDLAPAKFGMTKATYTTAKHTDGISPEEAAELFGFRDAQDMVNQLRGAGSRKAKAEAEADKLMAERYPDVMDEGDMRAEALDAAHSDAQAEMTLLELRHITDQRGADASRTARSQTLRAFQLRARAMIGQMRVQHAMKPDSFLQAERRAAKAAERAFARAARGGAGAQQALAEAQQAKEQQLLNQYLYREARELQALVDRKRAEMRKMVTSPDMRKKIGSPHIEQIEAILEDYEFRGRSQKAIDRTQAYAEYVAQMEAEGRIAELRVNPELLAEARRKHYTRLTADEIRGVFDAVDNIAHIGRRTREVVTARRKRLLAESADRVAGQIRRNQKAKDTPRSGVVKGFVNLLSRIDTIAVRMDGGEEFGAFHDEIKRDIDEAQGEEQRQTVEAMERLEAIFLAHYSRAELKALGKKKSVNGRLWSREQIITMALNTGTESNYQRLLDPRVPDKQRLTTQELDALLATLDERDWRFVQDVWDFNESFWPALSEVEQRRTGVRPKKVAGKPMWPGAPAFVKGGYHRLFYDSSQSGKAAADEEQRSLYEGMSAGWGAKAQVGNGMTVSRMENANGRPVLLEFSTIPRAMRETVRLITLSEAVDAADRILRTAAVRTAMEDTGNLDTLNTLNLWLRDVASGPIYNTDVVNRAARLLKNNFTLARLAFNMKTVVLQATGLSQASVTIGHKNMVMGLAKYARHPVETQRAILAKSPFMQERQSTFQKDVYDFRNSQKVASPVLTGASRGMDLISKAGFWPIVAMQFNVVDVPVWLGAYEGALAEGKSEQDAIYVADRMVARSQDSGLMADRSAVERGTLNANTRQADFVRMFTTLGGYMLTKMNRANVEILRRSMQIREADSPALRVGLAMRLASDLLILYAFEAAAIGLMYSWMTDEDEPEDLRDLIVKETGFALVGGVPFVKDAANAFLGFDAGGVYGTGMGSLGKAYTQWAQGEVDDSALRATLDLIGTGTGLPTTATYRILEQFVGDDEFSGAEMLFGSNPLTR